MPDFGASPPDREELDRPVLFGRSSSHFTRITRILAAELGVDVTFRIVPNLLSRDPADYGGNPALKIPTLRTKRGAWFGALPICRELTRISRAQFRTVWPEELETPELESAQELVLSAMGTEVSWLLSRLSGASDESSYQTKMHESLSGTLAWLEEHAPRALEALPGERDLSYLEVALFCLVKHLEFREVLPIAPYPRLNEFCQRFAERPSAQKTEYRFDS